MKRKKYYRVISLAKHFPQKLYGAKTEIIVLAYYLFNECGMVFTFIVLIFFDLFLELHKIN